MTDTSKAERINHANDVIRAISQHGRKFFYDPHSGRTAHFILSETGQIFFIDDYTGKKVCMGDGKCLGFTHGGTLHSIVVALDCYIRTGTKLTPYWYFGPWPDWICGGDLWGYGFSEMEKLRRELSKIPAIKVQEQDK